MSHMSGIIRRMREFLCRNDGLISTYFLLMMLCACTWLMVFTYNSDRYLKALENMKKNSIYFVTEAVVIRDLQCRGIETCASGSYEKDGISYTVEAYEDCLYAEIGGRYAETLIIRIDREQGMILTYSCVRNEETVAEY